MKSFQQITEELELHEAKEKAVVFMFGRFNPPTAGHEKLVEKAVATARRMGIRDVRLYPSLSQDPKKNPLPHREKVKFLQRFFPKVKVVDDKDAISPFAVARLLDDEGIKRVVMIAGGDRRSEFQTGISKYVGHSDPNLSLGFEEFTVVGAGARDPDAEGVSGMSASKLRGFAAAKDFGNFVKGLPSRASRRDADALFAAVRKGMNLREGVQVTEQLDEKLAALDKWWFNVKSNEAIEVTDDYHVQPIVRDPERFGLSEPELKILVPRGKEKSDIIPPLQRYMKKRGWVEITWLKTPNLITMRALDSKVAQKALQWVLNRLNPDPSEVVIEHRGAKAFTLKGRAAINGYARTGKVLRVSPLAAFREHDELNERIRGLSKWWYNWKTRKAFEIRENYHIQAVANDLKKFGITQAILDRANVTEKDLEAARANKIEVIPPLEAYMLDNGWVMVTWSHNIEELTLTGGSVLEVRMALKWALVKVHPSPATVVAESPDVGFVRLSQDQIDIFAKTGRVSRSRVAAFREFNEEVPMAVDIPKEAKEAIVKLFSRKQGVTDADVHALAEKLGIDPHKFEGYIYAMLQKKLTFSEQASLNAAMGELEEGSQLCWNEGSGEVEALGVDLPTRLAEAETELLNRFDDDTLSDEAYEQFASEMVEMLKEAVAVRAGQLNIQKGDWVRLSDGEIAKVQDASGGVIKVKRRNGKIEQVRRITLGRIGKYQGKPAFGHLTPKRD